MQQKTGNPRRLRFVFSWSLLPLALLLLGVPGFSSFLLGHVVTMGLVMSYAFSTLFQFLLIGLALWLERGRWSDFFITRKNLESALQDGIWIALVFVPIGWLYARVTLGGVYWLPLRDWLPTFLAALIPAGLGEELTYRALLLGMTQRWGIPPVWAVLLVGLLHGPVFHQRYLWRGDFITLSIVTAFSFLVTWLTLKRRNVVGAVIGHTAMDFLIFLFIGGKVTRL